VIKNRKLSKSIVDVNWFELRRMVEYKAKWYGREIRVAPSNYQIVSYVLILGLNQSNKRLRLQDLYMSSVRNCNGERYKLCK